MRKMENWSKSALFDEWWYLISGDTSSAVGDKIFLSRHFGLRVEGFGETPDINFDPMDKEAQEAYRLLEEVLTRVSQFPSENLGRYIGTIGDSRAQIQWSLMTMYNAGFRCALKSVKRMGGEE